MDSWDPMSLPSPAGPPSFSRQVGRSPRDIGQLAVMQRLIWACPSAAKLLIGTSPWQSWCSRRVYLGVDTLASAGRQDYPSSVRWGPWSPL